MGRNPSTTWLELNLPIKGAAQRFRLRRRQLRLNSSITALARFSKQNRSEAVCIFRQGEDQRPFMTAEIAPRASEFETSAAHQGNDIVLLSGSDLEDDEAVRLQQWRQRPRETAIGDKTIRTTVESEQRIMVPDLARQHSNFGRWNVGRIGQNHVEAPIKAGGPIALAEHGAIREAVAFGIAGRHAAGSLRKIDPHPARKRTLAQQSKQQASRTGAEIENIEGLKAAPIQSIQRSLDDRLAVGARLQRFGGQGESQPPELALADDPPCRLARQAPRGEALQRRDLRAVQSSEGIGRSRARDGLDQDARIETGIVETGGDEG